MTAKIVTFPLDRRAEQIAANHDHMHVDVDARLADILRPLSLRLMTTVIPPLDDDGPEAA